MNPIGSVAYAFGVLRGLAASLIRVAAGERGPVLPGYLPGPVAAPVEENVRPDEVTHLRLVDSPEDRDAR